MRTSLLALLGMAVTAGVAHANDVEPRQASATVASPNLTNIIRSDCADSTGSPWSSLGIATRPSWVNLCTERRLRILPSLPAIAQSITADANNYFGTKGPGLAVGLVLEDGLYYSQGFGFVDAGKSKHPDEDTVFRAGSLSKVITGTALLTLIDDPTRTPALSLEDDADAPRYLPELKYVCPLGKGRCKRGSSSLGIKLKHLVSHTAGLPNVMEQTNANIDPWLTDLKKSFTIFSPGEYSAYSGVSAEAIGLIEQRVSKAPSYVAFVTDSLFKPLGMTHSSMDQKDVSANLLAQRWMFGVNGNSWSFVPDNAIIPGDDQAMILPAGGLATSIGDLARFMRMWISGVAPVVNGHSLLKKATLQAANLPQVNVGTKPPASCGATPDTNGFSYRGCGPANAFGVNWYVGSMPFIEHNGDEPGRSGSETMIDAPAKMGATGLVSTEP
ncbi:MAG TPA: serine hydrolase, partial [Polyangiaceae bacterium]|nr:serine hydrolase [Polyangiaceae bacterium]